MKTYCMMGIVYGMIILWSQNQHLILNDDLEMDSMDYYRKARKIHATKGIVIKTSSYPCT